MSKFRLSMAVISALGILGTANAGTFTEALENASLNGAGFFRYTAAGLNDYKDSGADFVSRYGGAYQHRIILDASSAEIDGYKVNVGVFFNSGGLATPAGSAYGNLGGSRMFDINSAGGHGLNVNQLNVSKSFADSGVNLSAGTLKLATPITAAGAGDRGNGVLATASSSVGTLVAAYFDNWTTDNFERMGSDLGGIENNLAAIGLLNSAPQGLYYNAFFANAHKAVDLISFLEAGITTGAIKAGAQVAYTIARDTNGWLQTGTKGILTSVPTLGGGLTSDNGIAGARGVYNVQVAYAGAINAKLGYTGSFGEGYGVFPHHTGSFNMGGKLWYGSHGTGANGINLLGSGAEKGSRVSVVYAQVAAKADKFNIALDLAYDSITGWNIPGVGTRVGVTNDGTGTLNKVSFFEVTPSVTYNLNKNVSLFASYGVTFGDVAYSLGEVKASYKF